MESVILKSPASHGDELAKWLNDLCKTYMSPSAYLYEYKDGVSYYKIEYKGLVQQSK